MPRLEFKALSHQQVSNSPDMNELRVGELRIGQNDVLDFGEPLGIVQTEALQEVVARWLDLTWGTCKPQLAACVFSVTRLPYTMRRYFPLTKILDDAELKQFDDLMGEIAHHPNLDVRLIAEQRQDISEQLPIDAVYLVAGHLAELFFYRRDILERLLSIPHHFWLYTTTDAFKQAGGVSGGCYNPELGCLQLVVSRIYEGFNGIDPGGAPLLHEFGHLLDFFDASHGTTRKSIGLPTGMRPSDGPIYTPQAHELFRRGKRLELERYMRFYERPYAEGDTDPLPVGHPYVFQNDREFVAGYLEMFFRNPHYFAELNPDLYQGFAELFRQDPRRVWSEDYQYYIRQNRGFYLSGKRPGKPGLTIE